MSENAEFNLQKHPDGTVLPVRAQPKARRREIRLQSDGTLKVCVTAPPEKGRANKAIIALLWEVLGNCARQIELVAGETSPHKRVLVHGATPDEVAAEIRRALARPGK